MFKNIYTKLKESFISIFPIVLVVLALGLTISPLSIYEISLFLISFVFLVVGMALFTVGADSAMFTIGNSIGANLSKSRKLTSLVLFSFILGFIITIAEPDLTVLANQIISLNKWLFIICVAIGVGIFLALAVLRIVFHVSLKKILIITYSLVILLMLFVSPELLPVSIDSGAVTTGPISTPFLLAFGMGISAVRGGKTSEDDSFGLIALVSAGPLITTLILCLFASGDVSTTQTIITESQTGSFSTMLQAFGTSFLQSALEISIVLAPIIVFFFIYNKKYLKFPKTKIIKIIIGLAYTFFGIVLFLTGVMAGFLPIGSVLGFQIASSKFSMLLLPISAIIGLLIVLAEPAVHVLNQKIEEITGGVIKKSTMMLTMSIGVGVSLVIVVVRAMYNIDFIYFILPLYALILIATIFCPNIFTAIAFDSGGVASGTMAASFILPFVMGICEAFGIGIMAGAFGTVALIACLPILSILILGIIYDIISKRKAAKTKIKSKKAPIEIIDFDLGD